MLASQALRRHCNCLNQCYVLEFLFLDVRQFGGTATINQTLHVCLLAYIVPFLFALVIFCVGVFVRPLRGRNEKLVCLARECTAECCHGHTVLFL